MDADRDAWVDLPSRDDMRAAGMGDYHGFIPAMARLIGAHPRVAAQFGALFGAVMRTPGTLTVREREMVAAVTAAAQDCFY